MTRSKPPLVFRLAGGIVLAATAIGHWWQSQPVGPSGQAIQALVARHCPTAMPHERAPAVADTARALDRWAYDRLGDLLLRDGRDRCRPDHATSSHSPTAQVRS